MTSGRFFSFAKRRADLRGEFAVGDQDLGLAMLEDVGDGRGSSRVLMVLSTAPSIGTP